MNRQEAWDILCEHTKTDRLRKHALAVEAAMKAYAGEYGGDEEKWIGFARTMSRRDQSETQLSSELWRQVFSGHCIGWCYFDFELDDELPF